MIKFIHTADIHLDSPLKGLEAYEYAPVEQIRGATRRAFENLIDLAIEEEVNFILIAGDLYDGDWKDSNTGIYFASTMGRLKKAGIKVYIASGNHDAASQITKTMPLPDNVSLFSSKEPQTEILDSINVAIHGQSYSSRAVIANLASQYPQYNPNFFNIGVLHTSLTGREGHENYAPCSLNDLESKGYDYWALGHIHKREVVSEDPLILFPGNIQGRHIKETGAKGATLVTVEDGMIAEVKEMVLDVLRWSICRVDLSECDTKEHMYKIVRSAIEKERDLVSGKTLALRLHLEGRCLLHAELHARSIQITEEIRSIAASLDAVWLEKVILRTNRMSSFEEIDGKDSPLTSLLQAVESLDLEEGTLSTLVPDIAKLNLKLPAELLDVNSMQESHPENSSELQEEVKELLLARLIQSKENES
ncbi:MAG: DNA repair exonuclease [Candidatus Marinimicrobia bacterium]|nr:DNA repair exonuclease [Candidatus Neomarinimicrobiota bacterium]